MTDARAVTADQAVRIGRAEPRLQLVDRDDAAMMSLGTVGSGVLAYAFNVVAARSLGAEAYGAVGALWASMFLIAVLLFRPLEQTVSRTVADGIARHRDTRPVVHRATWMALATATLASALLLAAWSAVTEGLFGGRALLTAALIVGVAGYAASYLVRGVCGGVRWFGGYGLLLLSDGAVRVLIALPLVVVASPAVAAAAIALAAWGGAVAPLLSRRRGAFGRLRAGPAPTELRVRSAMRFGLPAVAIAGSEQVLISGGPLLVLIGGGPNAARDAGVVFAATLLLRAPVFLFQGIQASLLPSLTTYEARGDHAEARRATVVTAGILSAFAAMVAVAAVVGGPFVMSLLYGDEFSATNLDLAILALGVGGFLAAGTFCQALLARARTALAAGCWVSGAVVFVAAELVLSGAVMHRVCLAFAAGSLLTAALTITSVWRTAP